jgi:hypothetical protein
LSGTADGVPLSIVLSIVSASTCAPLVVFSDGSALELATIGGSVSGGLTATLTVAFEAPARKTPSGGIQGFHQSPMS